GRISYSVRLGFLEATSPGMVMVRPFRGSFYVVGLFSATQRYLRAVLRESCEGHPALSNSPELRSMRLVLPRGGRRAIPHGRTSGGRPLGAWCRERPHRARPREPLRTARRSASTWMCATR